MTSNERLQILFMLRIKCIAQEGAKCSGTKGERGSTSVGILDNIERESESVFMTFNNLNHF